MDTHVLYNERMNRMLVTSDHIEPDRVPVFTIIGTWGISYYGTTYQKCLDNKEWYVKEVDAKIYREMSCDIIMSAGLITDFEIDKIIGYGNRFISPDGVTLQHREGPVITEEDYPALIKNPMKFFIEQFIPRKCPNLTVDQTVKAVHAFMEGGKDMQWIPKYYKDEFGLVYIIDGLRMVSSPMDMIFDSIRGLKGTLIDIRRNPQMVLDAIDALYPMCEAGLMLEPNKKYPAFPFGSTMFHSPTYLSTAQFEKFFAPTYNKLVDKLTEAGIKLFVYLEGDWSAHYDWLNSLPKNQVLAIVEKDDIFKIKKAVGDNITLVGGMPLNILKYKTKEECIDYAKKVLQECAPGGGFIFGTDKTLQCPGDVNTENFIAVNNWVYENGYY